MVGYDGPVSAGLPIHTASSAKPLARPHSLDLDSVTLTLGEMAELGVWPNEGCTRLF